MDGLPEGFQLDDEQSRQFGFPVAVNARGERMRYRPAGKPLPVGIQKLEDGDIDALKAAGDVAGSMATQRQRLEGGQLDLGPIKNRVSEFRNWAGMSDPNSRNYASFRASLEKMRNDSLRLNKGVQTEGDAQRAWNELIANINDEKLVAQRLAEINEINRRAAQVQTSKINSRRLQYGAPPIDPKVYAGNIFDDAQGAQKPAGWSGALPAAQREAAMRYKGSTGKPGTAEQPFVPTNEREYANLPSGAHYIHPSGKLKVKP